MNNQEKGQSAAEAEESGTQPTERTIDQRAEPELIVTDKRRYSSDGEAIEREQDFQKDLTTEPSVPSEIEELRARLKEAEEKRIEAERQVRDFADRFRHAQAKLQGETDEQRARLQRTFDQ